MKSSAMCLFIGSLVAAGCGPSAKEKALGSEVARLVAENETLREELRRATDAAERLMRERQVAGERSSGTVVRPSTKGPQRRK
jgi:hypothetical protein